MPRETKDKAENETKKKKPRGVPVRKRAVLSKAKAPVAATVKAPAAAGVSAADRALRLSALREIIDAQAMIAALEKHVLGLGEAALTPSQVSTALALLKKVLPDAPAAVPCESDVRRGKKEEAADAVSHEDAILDLE